MSQSESYPTTSECERLRLQADEELCVLRRENVDLLKRLEEDQDDLNELMKKHKALIAQVARASDICRLAFCFSLHVHVSQTFPLSFQSSSDICQIRELQTELEDVKKQRQGLQEEVATPPPSS